MRNRELTLLKFLYNRAWPGTDFSKACADPWLQEEKSETAEKLNLAQNENDILIDQLEQYKKVKKYFQWALKVI